MKFMDQRVSPLVYLLMGASLVVGLFFATGLIVGSSESILYTSGVLVNRQVWGLCLMTTSAIAIYGFIVRNEGLVSAGGIGGFMAWLFAGISLALQAHWYVFITIGMLHLLFHVYVVVASTLGNLFRG